MNRRLLQSPAFIRTARRVLKRSPHFDEAIRIALQMLSEDAFHPTLKTHELKGDLSGRWASSVAYDLRVVFRLVQHENEEAILLMSIGTHDEVY